MKSLSIFIGIAIALIACDYYSVNTEPGPDTCVDCIVACAKQPETGPCEARVKKYYFDESEGKCKEFFWGGCQGVVPFESMKACESCKCASPGGD
jgi:Kunitz/Bovine pancreatic trypsin inhibitor domain